MSVLFPPAGVVVLSVGELTRALKELVESGRFHPVVDRSYPLEEVIEASRYVETEQKTGNVILTP